ncbi:MAG: hypothetical protein VR64_13340 [Desulfatitalea sp. BRH_c12]|nr:MAG: hypothetical protein VR64_13340 [Desulfatitalea sp. BRH_c12]
MTTWLLYPPFADPTQPYVALPYLKGALKAEGWDATVVDLNVAAAHHLLARPYIEDCARKIAERFMQLNTRKKLTALERMAYLALADARAAALRLLRSDLLPVQILQDAARFYDFRQYRQARDLAEDAMTCVSAAHFPYRFHFNQAAHVAVPWGPAMLETYFRKGHSPLATFYRSFLADADLRPGDVVGINVTFISQIPEAFYLAQLVQQEAPHAFIVLGGSCLQQILAQADEAVRRWIVTVADAACAFEGEKMLPMLLAALAQEEADVSPGQRFEQLRLIPNVLIRDPAGSLHNGPLHITDLEQQAPPDYADLDLDGYLAPERTLLFAPTRGCYWNRCAFCDYGMSRSECHGYREMAPEAAAEQLLALSRDYAVDHFYLSVDVMAPRFALAMAETLIERAARIHWSADFRIENAFTAERCALLHQSGLRAVAFGVESGSDRMLQQMDKGITTRMIRSIGARFQEAGIATAWMTFSDHPLEEVRDALATVRLIDREKAAVDLFILGRFGLTAGSRIAAHPAQFGLKRVFYCAGDDFRLFPLFETDRQPSPKAERRLDEAVVRLSQNYYLDHYPWAGAISTHHTFLYFLRFGQHVFRQLQTGPPMSRPSRRKVDWPGLTVRPAFALDRLRGAHERHMQAFWQTALSAGNAAFAPLDEPFFQSFFRNT